MPATSWNQLNSTLEQPTAAELVKLAQIFMESVYEYLSPYS
jgi:hypothetical protein